MSSARRPEATYWPNGSQELLLRAALCPEDEAIAAWGQWRQRNDLVETHLDQGSFRLLPLVYRRLQDLGHEDAWGARLKGIYRHAWSFNQSLFHEASRLIEQLRWRRIDALILKGAALSVLYYRNAAVRPMADVDVLVPGAQVREALACLAAAGWRATSQRVDEDLRFRHSLQMVDAGGREFDLHWHAFAESLQPDADDGVWLRSVPIEIGGVPTVAMGPADTLIHVVVHGVRLAKVPPVRWIVDAATVLAVAGPKIDWDLVVHEAERRRVFLRLQTGLRYLRETFGTAVPDTVLAPRRASFLERTELRYTSLSKAQRVKVFFGAYPFVFVGCLRFLSGKNAWRKVSELPEVLCYSLGLKRRRQIPVLLLRNVVNKLRKS